MKTPLFLRNMALVLWLGACSLAHGAVMPATVAQATLVIGVANLTDASGLTKSLVKGEHLREGDQIQTGAGGHVHLRFVDGGKLSVRPGSVLTIQNYSQAGERSEQTAIRFKLDVGATRSITGSWGQSERDRFRLNTPIAAIGIEGTDFSVAASPGQTFAGVYTGAIRVAPLEPSCVDTFGSCQSSRSTFLTQDMKGQLIALAAGQPLPRMVAGKPGNAGAADASAQSTAGQLDTHGQALEDGIALEARSAELSEAIVSRLSRLVWMRWPWTEPTAANAFVEAFDLALVKGMELSVSDGAYLLLRDNPYNLSPRLADLGRADFELRSGLAELVPRRRVDGQPEVLDLNSGRLSVNFAASTYETAVNVSGAKIGVLDLTSSGRIVSGVNLEGVSGSMATKGALSVDGREAAYFFYSTQAAGQVRGITLWGQ